MVGWVAHACTNVLNSRRCCEGARGGAGSLWGCVFVLGEIDPDAKNSVSAVFWALVGAAANPGPPAPRREHAARALSYSGAHTALSE